MAQRQQQVLDLRAQSGGDGRQHLALFDKGKVAFGRILLLAAGDGPGTVVVLAWVQQAIPVGHLDRGVALVEDGAVLRPQRLVMEVRFRLQPNGRLKVARGRLVGAGEARHGVESMAQRLDVQALDVNLHPMSPCKII